jgi:SulP family sulfate permease
MRSSLTGSTRTLEGFSHFADPQQEESHHRTTVAMERLGAAAGQLPAILLIGMFHLMIAIPFGVSYFPVGWRAQGSGDTEVSEDDLVHGTFPLPAKEALGIRMFLFSTILGQIIFTLVSGFRNPIGLQMVENVPFCHALSQLVIRHQGYGTEALSTLFFLFGLSSVIAGTVFMVLGQLKLGRIVYYFPNHVLVGCIAGIGVFLAKTGIEVTIDAVIVEVWEDMHLVVVVVLFEAVLRIMDLLLRNKEGKPLYSLLSPIYFCLMTPIFYLGLWILNVDAQDAMEAGYFFPSLQGSDSSIFNDDLVTMWHVVNFKTISWPAVYDSIPTMVALTLFSLIHVPINIPAFALSTSEYFGAVFDSFSMFPWTHHLPI